MFAACKHSPKQGRAMTHVYSAEVKILAEEQIENDGMLEIVQPGLGKDVIHVHRRWSDGVQRAW